jgi:hypothetical protein
MYKKILLSPKQILDVLIDAGAIKRSASLSVQSLPGDAGRRPGARRELHRIWRDGRPRVQLYIAPDLNSLERCATEFYRACPSIVCKPLFFVKHEGFDFLGIEFAEGVNAETAYAAQALSADALVQSLTVLDAALSQTEEPSTSEAAAAELDGLLLALRHSELLSGPDQALLESFIVPKLKSALLTGEPKTRWTNGDFIARNMIVGRRGAKLVDYEFAARTHFYGEDWARLSRYSAALPAAALDLVNARLGERRIAFDVYGLLRQIVLESRIKPVGELHRETGNIARQLIPLLDLWRAETMPSVFLPRPQNPAVPGSLTAQAQVYYSNTPEFHESNSLCDDVIEGVWKRVELPIPIGAGSWHIRLDPVRCAGIVEVVSVEISGSGGAGRESIALPDLTAAGTCAAVAVAPALTLICYGPDPQLHLPVLPIEGPGPIRLAVWMRWERLETGLGRAVAEMARDTTNDTPGDKAAIRQLEIKIEELTATLDRECLLRAASERIVAELRSACTGNEEHLRAGLAQLAGLREQENSLRARALESEAALEREQRVRMELEAVLEEQVRAQAQFETLVSERQRIHDSGAVQSLARIRELTASLNEERTARESSERTAVESAHGAAERELHNRAELERAHADLERIQSDYEAALQQERAVRAQTEALLEVRDAAHKAAEASFGRSLADIARGQRQLETQLREGNEHQRNLEKHIASAQLRIASLERSLSWKVTAPVRRAANLLHWK